MSQYLKLFKDKEEYETYTASTEYSEIPQVSHCIEEVGLYVKEPPPPHDYSNDYFTIVSLEDDNDIKWGCNGGHFKTIQVSTDNGETWLSKTSQGGNGTLLATLNTNDKLLVKGNNKYYGENTLDNYNKFFSTKNINVEGNIMSLCYGDDFRDKETLQSNYVFRRLFYRCETMISAQNLILPSTTLVTGCYSYMFWQCTSLTIAPVLSATALTYNCYSNMFRDCTSLESITCLATDISANSCTYNWVSNVATSGTFIKANNMNDWTIGTDGIPTGWSVQDAS